MKQRKKEERGKRRRRGKEEGRGETGEGGRDATHSALTDIWQKVKLYCVKAPEFGGRLL